MKLHEEGYYGYSEGFVPTSLASDGFKVSSMMDEHNNFFIKNEVCTLLHKGQKFTWEWAVINKPVIVMALYDIGRDNWKNFNLSYNTYLWWMKNTLSLDTDFVIYTEEKFSEKIREMREEFDPTFQKTKLL